MIKLNIKHTYIYKIVILVFMIMEMSSISHASEGDNFVIILGQVINMEQGNPVEGHIIYIESDDIETGTGVYSKTVRTNSEGYYYDTVTTTRDKGSFVIYTHDYYGNVIDTIAHFRFMNRERSVITADFLLYSPYQIHNLQARFKYVQKEGEDRNEYSFFDQTDSDNIIEWHWDFGDGTSSNIQNPEHLYEIHGLFRVTFTVTALINNVLKTSTIIKQIYLSDRAYFNLGGHVFSEYFPIDMGYAYLYMIDSLDQYVAIDTIAFDTLGYYFFYQIPEANYIIKVEPMCESQFYGRLLPTYFGDNLFWQDAEIINLVNTCWECDIALKHSTGFLIGEGGISGNIVYDDMLREVYGTTAKGINVHLYDDSNNLLTCHYSDELGDFSFDLIELVTYWLYPEITGIYAERIKVELTPETPIIDDIEIRILMNSTSSSIPEDDYYSNDIVGLPYPNPTSEMLYIPLNYIPNTNVSYEIYDFLGHIIISRQDETIDSSDGFYVSTRYVKNGSYILRIIVNDKVYNRVFVVAK